jgi:CRP/FNR family transcriptional regulator, nitrogen fixation regulation protein
MAMYSYLNRPSTNCKEDREDEDIAMPVKPTSSATKGGAGPSKGNGRGRLPPAIESLAALTPCHRGQDIQSRGGRVDDWYRIVAGMATKSVLMADGRRQIVDFLLPGDFFGFSARDTRAFDVEAASEGTVVARYPRRLVEPLVDSDPRIARQIRERAFESISRVQARVLILGQPTSLKKVCAFLLEMAERSGGRASGEIVLPMSRYDIADYLAVSVETVSRALTSLQRRRVIALSGRRKVKIIDRAAVEEGCQKRRAMPPTGC